MRGWNDLGVVETIYEEEHEDYSSASPSLSPTPSSPPATLHSTVRSWSLTHGCETDVIIHVQDSCFHLHKDPLIRRSGYLKRQLTDASEITICPPLNIAAETFTLVGEFCYSKHVVITVFNVVALRTAAESLEMTGNNGDGEHNLSQITESYFRHAISVNLEYATILFRSSLSLLPEAEETAVLASRCLEALALMNGGDGNVSWVEEIKTVGAENFKSVADSMHRRFSQSHDLLYRIVDFYLKEHTGKLTEEDRTEICSFVDCNKLSSHLLMHAVQNPRMPLRFIVRAMLLEQLNTRRAIFSAAQRRQNSTHHNQRAPTLGSILHRDAALRQVAQLKAAMDATTSHLQNLETNLDGVKKLLTESARFPTGNSLENKIQRGEKGYSSSRSFQSCLSTEGNARAKIEKSIGRRLMSGLTIAFRGLKSQRHSKSGVLSAVNVDGDENGVSIMICEKGLPCHRRSRSLF